jgi:hypothetical protein
MGSKLDCARQVIAVPLRPTVSYSEHMSSNAVAQSAAWEASQYGKSEDIGTLQDKGVLRLADLEQSKNAVLHSFGAARNNHTVTPSTNLSGGTVPNHVWHLTGQSSSGTGSFSNRRTSRPPRTMVRLAAVRRLEAQGKGIILNLQPAMTPTIVLLPHFNPS